MVIKIRILIIGLLLLVGKIVTAQDAESYKTIAQNKSLDDSIRIAAYNAWDDLIYYNNPELDQEINEEIIKLAKSALDNKQISEQKKKFFQASLLRANNIVGINLDTKAYYYQALNHYYEAIKYARILKDEESEGAIANNIGLVHELQGNLEKAKEFYLTAETMAIKYADTSGLVSVKNNLGSLHSTLENFELSNAYYSESISLAKEANNKGQLASSLQNLGVLYEVQDQFDSALYYYDACLLICEQENTLWQEHAKVLYNIGSIYIQKDPPNYYTALSRCTEGYNMSSEHNARFTMSSCATCLYKAYKSTGKIDSAFKYIEIASELTDSLNDKEKTILIAQKQSEFEYQQRAIADSIVKIEEKKVYDAIVAKKEAQKKQASQRLLYLSIVLVLVVFFGLFIYSRLQVTKRQKEVISKQKRESDNQKEVIAEQHKEISDSINYAEHIQHSVLPELSINDLAVESFVLFKPKDKVSGDFYWLEKNENFTYYVVADCTGHGIPGAFISMIGTILLNEIYNSKNLKKPNLILDELNRLVRLTLTNREGETIKDGMDIAMVAVDHKHNKLLFSGANNPLWLVTKQNHVSETKLNDRSTVSDENDVLIEFKATKQPVGMYAETAKPFSLHEINYQEGDIFYLFSDGYADQFGGEKGKKYKYKNFKNLLLTISKQNMQSQKELLSEEFVQWKGDHEQIDDVCVLGVKL